MSSGESRARENCEGVEGGVFLTNVDENDSMVRK